MATENTIFTKEVFETNRFSEKRIFQSRKITLTDNQTPISGTSAFQMTKPGALADWATLSSLFYHFC